MFIVALNETKFRLRFFHCKSTLEQTWVGTTKVLKLISRAPVGTFKICYLLVVSITEPQLGRAEDS